MINIKTNWKKNTALFITGQTITLFGSMLVQYAIFWHIMLEKQSGTIMTAIVLTGFLPMFLISPFSGVWADRFNRKLLINISDGIIAVVSLITAILLLNGYTHYAILLAVSSIRALGQGVQQPAVAAVIPQIVPKEHLTRVNGIQSSIQSACNLAAPMLSAALLSLIPISSIFFIDIITAIIGISVLFFFVKVPNVKHGKNEAEPESHFHALAEGLRYIRTHGFILRFIIFYVVFMLLVSPTSFLTPLQLVRNFGEEIWRLGVFETAFAGGMVLGGIIIASWGGFKNKIYTMVLSCFIGGLLSVALGITPVFWIYIVITILWGITIPLFNTPMMVLMQTKVENEFMGRVMSVFTMAQSSMMPLGLLFFGPLADKVSIDLILIVTGIAITIQSFSLLSSKTLRRTGL